MKTGDIMKAKIRKKTTTKQAKPSIKPVSSIWNTATPQEKNKEQHTEEQELNFSLVTYYLATHSNTSQQAEAEAL